ncbi:Heparanase-like protein 2 [Apostasia shenzhenica]|uniref:Heparanase-like protein 2 n=1 Tax=Apostasia shenzhenica TaxID=1088818 RepID=A0A2I0AZP0_9ASPA|nr:Heparanase-like protein 2 [Apostasia shenzhenica]
MSCACEPPLRSRRESLLGFDPQIKLHNSPSNDLRVARKIIDPNYLSGFADTYRDVQLTIQRRGPWPHASVSEASGVYNSGSRDAQKDGSLLRRLKRSVLWVGRQASAESQRREEYHLTAENGAHLSRMMLLNGKPLQAALSSKTTSLRADGCRGNKKIHELVGSMRLLPAQRRHFFCSEALRSLSLVEFCRPFLSSAKALLELYENSSSLPSLVALGVFFNDPEWYSRLLEVSGQGALNALSHHVYNLGGVVCSL